MEPMYIDKSPRKYYSFPVRQHNFWEITINLVGNEMATIDGQEYPFQRGTIFCLAPGVAHGKVSAGGFIDGSLMLPYFVPFVSTTPNELPLQSISLSDNFLLSIPSQLEELTLPIS